MGYGLSMAHKAGEKLPWKDLLRSVMNDSVACTCSIPLTKIGYIYTPFRAIARADFTDFSFARLSIFLFHAFFIWTPFSRASHSLHLWLSIAHYTVDDGLPEIFRSTNALGV